MASVSRQPAGRKSVQFFNRDGIRRTIRLGKCSLDAARTVKGHVEKIVAASITGHALDNKTAEWVAGLGQQLNDRLAAVGLIAPREAVRLGGFIDGYIASRTDVKPSTLTVYGHTRRNLLEFFGADKLLRDITVADADDWRRHLATELTAKNTVARRSGIAKQFFKAAIDREILQANPFAKLKAQVKGNRAREFFVTPEMAAAVLAACPDAEWRLLFALARYGGLRCPSETLRLRWADVDWERDRFTVHASKTAHHADDGIRVVPIFRELAHLLRDVFEQAEPGTEYVINRYRHNENLRTQLGRIIKRAGLTPWPKPWQNLRATRETELAETFPSHVVCGWIGNSPRVANEHYLQITDAHYERAADDNSALQKAVQYPGVSPCTAENPKTPNPADGTANADMLVGATPDNYPETVGMGDTGLEPVTSRV